MKYRERSGWTETIQLMLEAIEVHLAPVAEDGDPVPEPTTVADYMEVDVPKPVKGNAE